jgi:VanZ family protein
MLIVAGIVIALADEASQWLSVDRGPSLLDALLFDIPGYLIGASLTKWLLQKKHSKLNVS